MTVLLDEKWNSSKSQWSSLVTSVPPSFNFTMANMMEYFKDINSKTFPLFKAGHVQSVLHKEIDNNILLECKCFPEMKKTTTTYGIRVALDRSSNDIIFARCGCPAGRGPTCCCKHLRAFCYSWLRQKGKEERV